MDILATLRHVVGGSNGREHRDSVRAGAREAVVSARVEIQKSRDLRELLALERQYGTRIRAKGKPRRA